MSLSIEQKVIEIISKYIEEGQEALSLDTKLEDSGLDSMGVVEVLFDIEDFFGITMLVADDIEERFNLGNTGDIVDEITRLINEKDSAT